MNSNDPNFDWHKTSIWVAHSPTGAVEHSTAASTPHSCRSHLLGQRSGSTWTDLKFEGYVIHEYGPAIPTLTDVIKVGDQVAVGVVPRWQYPHIGETAPDGVVVQLLTRGGIAVRGVWNDLGDYIAWAPMLKRDKEIERRLEP